MLVGVLLISAGGCATSIGRHEFLGQEYRARSGDSPVEVFATGAPTKSFVKVARLDVHLEKSGFVTSNLESALPELRRQAREAGCDAVIDIVERRSQVLETMVYHVTATGVRYVDSD